MKLNSNVDNWTSYDLTLAQTKKGWGGDTCDVSMNRIKSQEKNVTISYLHMQTEGEVHAIDQQIEQGA